MANSGGSKALTLAEDGAIAGFYTQSNFCKVYPVLQIYKIKWSFSKRGAKGAGFDIYMEIPVFMQLIKSIISGQLFKQIEEDRQDSIKKYPEAWKHAMGVEASNVIAFGPASKGNGIVMQGQSKHKKQNVFIPIDILDLIDMAETGMDVLNLYKEPDNSLVPVYGWRRDRACRILTAMESYRHDEIAEPDTPANMDSEDTEVPDEAMSRPSVKHSKITTISRVAERKAFPGAYAFQGMTIGDSEKHNFVITQECAARHLEFIKNLVLTKTGQVFQAEYTLGYEGNTPVYYIDKLAV